MTAASALRFDLAMRVLDAHRNLPGLVTSFVTGSTAEGIADEASDLDMFLGFDELPPEADLDAMRQTLDPNEPKWKLGAHADGELLVSIRMDGVEVQYGCQTMASLDGEIDRLVAGEYVRAPEQKIAMGLAIATPLLGGEVFERRRERIARYPEALRNAMIDAHMPRTPIWRIWQRVEGRDAALWIRKECVECGYLAAGLLAGMNGVWHSDFQFKRITKFCDALTAKPAGLEASFEVLANGPLPEAVEAARTLFAEIAKLLEPDPRAATLSKLAEPALQ